MEPSAEFDTEWTTKFEDMYGEGRVAGFGLGVSGQGFLRILDKKNKYFLRAIY